MKITNLNINRRETMLSLLAVATTGLVACRENPAERVANQAIPEYKIGDPFLNGDEMAFLTAIAGLIIPNTDTPGAVEAGVPDMIQELLSNWGDDSVRTYWRAGLKSVTDQFGGGKFNELGVEEQTKLLSALDSGVYNGSIDVSFYKDLKQAISGGYYMSEVGATQELAYDPVPGDFLGCIEFSEIGKAWAT